MYVCMCNGVTEAARHLAALLPTEAEALALQALMELQASRAAPTDGMLALA